MTFPVNHRGSALLTCMVLSLFVISTVAFYGWYNWIRSRENVSNASRQKALECADSGLNDALSWLRFPASGTDPDLFVAGSKTFSAACGGSGRYETVLSTHSNPNYLLADATGYYYLPRGSTVDPLTNQPAQIASIHAAILFLNVTKYFAAVNDPLEISAGSDFGNGSIYSDSLKFDGGPTIRLGAAFFSSTVTYQMTPPNVQFLQLPANPQQLPFALQLPTMEASISKLYQNRSQMPPSSALLPASTLSGTVQEPSNGSHVYYSSGDVHIGIGGGPSLFVDGVYVVYADGDILIHNNVQLASNSTSWVGFVSKGTIRIKSDAPSHLDLYGNYISNNGLIAEGAARSNIPAGSCVLAFTGGMVSPRTPSLATVWSPTAANGGCTRTYTFPDATNFPKSKSPDLYLPNLANVLEYTITRGRYR